MFKCPKINKVIQYHNEIIDLTGGMKGIKSIEQLESSLNNCYSTIFSLELYPTNEDKIVNIFYNLIKNHCFNDGNKRISVKMLYILCVANNLEIELTLQEMENLALDVASGKLNQEDIKKIFKEV